VTTFKDSLGREWNVALTAGAVRDVARATPVDLRTVTKLDHAEELARLVFFDPMTVMEVLWVLLGAQAKERNVDQAGFEAGFDAATNQRAREALWAAMNHFFRPPPIAESEIRRLPEILQAMAKAADKGHREKAQEADGQQRLPSGISSPS
jgi:hypothetical protein